MEIVVLRIPEFTTLRLATGVGAVDWTVGIISIGKGATFDVSAADVVPSAPFRKFLPTAAVRRAGDTGATGHPGASGAPGASLTIRGIERIDGEGQLWIRTDGGQAVQEVKAAQARRRSLRLGCSGYSRGDAAGAGVPGAVAVIWRLSAFLSAPRTNRFVPTPYWRLEPRHLLDRMPEARMMIYGAGGRAVEAAAAAPEVDRAMEGSAGSQENRERPA